MAHTFPCCKGLPFLIKVTTVDPFFRFHVQVVAYPVNIAAKNHFEIRVSDDNNRVGLKTRYCLFTCDHVSHHSENEIESL